MIELDEQFWDDRYLFNQEGWDLNQVSPPIKEYIDTSAQDKNTAILIPGCGNAYEASYLLEKGFQNITLVDISSVLVKRLQERFAGEDRIHIVHSDIFLFEGKFDLMIEQAFFCTFPPERRSELVTHVHGLLNPGGKIAGVLFNENVGYHDHPPFTGSLPEYQSYFKPYYDIRIMEPCLNSIGPRQGSEIFIELIKRIPKL